VQTALRECREEIDLDPATSRWSAPSRGADLGELDRRRAVPSAAGVAAALTHSVGEIDEVLTFPVRRLAEVESTMELAARTACLDGLGLRAGRHLVWGATGLMVHDLLEVLRKETSWL
jgi:hypothetical protein